MLITLAFIADLYFVIVKEDNNMKYKLILMTFQGVQIFN